MANRINRVRAITGAMAAIMIMSNIVAVTTFAAEPETICVEQECCTKVVPTGYRSVEDPEFRYVEKDENDRISADQFKALEISPELKAQLEAYLQASK